MVIAACSSNAPDTYSPYGYANNEYNGGALLGEEGIERYDSPSNVETYPDMYTSYIPTQINHINLDYVLAIANERRHNTHERDMDRINALIQEREPSSIDWSRLFYAPRARFVSDEEAIEDVKIFFDLLKHWYSAYEYFGGDSVFFPIRDEILETLAQRDQHTAGTLTVLLWNALSPIIADNHFTLDSHIFTTSSLFHVWETPFDRTPYGFRHRYSNGYISEVIGYHIDDVFHPTVTEEGEFYYVLIIVAPNPYGSSTSIYDLQVLYSNGDTETVRLINSQFDSMLDLDEPPSLRFENDIPIVRLQRMPLPVRSPHDDLIGFDENEALTFLSFAYDLQDEPAIIIDLRTNLGGFIVLSKMWLYRLTGEIVPFGFCHLTTEGLTIPNEAIPYLPEHWYRSFNPSDEWMYFLEIVREKYDPYLFINDYHWISGVYSRLVPNDRLIILLIDRFTSSAGEAFTSQILNMENTLVIGQNTSGTLLTSGALPLYLPNSGIPFNMGSSVFVHPESTWQEGVGYAPDVWVIGDALTAALAILNNQRLYCEEQRDEAIQ